jgi:hypothetical protein
MAQHLIDLTGKRFGRLVVVGRGLKHGNSWFWRCKCDCGSEARVAGAQLRRGRTQSCGCLMVAVTVARSTKHGHANRSGLTKTYRSWSHMIGRCRNPNDGAYRHYGGRGIQVCERWLESYQNFLEDMGVAPRGTSLDRVDVNGNYEASNCRWATSVQQGRNKRLTRRVQVEGGELPLAEFAEHNGVSPIEAARRVRRGWDPVSAGTIKPGTGKPRKHSDAPAVPPSSPAPSGV